MKMMLKEIVFFVLHFFFLVKGSQPLSDGDLRLLGSGSEDGILEIYHNSRWGAVCDDGWNSVASGVACRQLGFANYVSYRHYNRITNEFWIDDVSCNGDESSLVNCANSGWGGHNCRSTEGLYLRCTNDGALRLLGSGSDDGILEIYHNSRWGAVCDDGWNSVASSVACRQLGFTNYISYRHSNGITNEFWLDDVRCNGDESVLVDCANSGWGSHNCRSTEGLYLQCIHDGDLRLLGSGSDDGILEIYHNSRWGTVCDDGWNSVASGVACRQLGFANYVSYTHGKRITNEFWLDDVSCNGDESVLVDCANSGWGSHNCRSTEGLFLRCTNEGTLRLLGSGSNDGILEIYHNSRWGAVCDDGWNEVASGVACRQLGFANSISYTHGNRITNEFWLDDVSCNGDESVLVDCANSGWGGHNCGSTEGIYLQCIHDGSLRLLGSGSDDGIVEIYHNSRWGTVCDDGWDSIASSIACRQLGFPNYVNYRLGNRITNEFWLDDVSCNGDESEIADCANSGWGNDDCRSTEGIYLHCINDGALRLLGSGSNDGILEVYHNTRWGAVCDDGWNSVASLVACRQLGFPNYINYRHSNDVTNEFWLDDVRCNGDESVLVNCANSGWGSDNCGSTEGLYLHCLHDGALRLLGSGSDDGILEIYHNNRWGAVCDDEWSSVASLVACRQLGFANYVSYRHYNRITNDFWIDDVSCNGDESVLVDCANSGWGSHNCASTEGLYLQCTHDGDLRLLGSGSNDGILEIYHNSRWGAVCDDGWNPVASFVACRQLGFPDYINYGHGNRITNAFWLDDVRCNGDETVLINCANSGWGSHNCAQTEGLYLNCLNDGSLRLMGSGSDDGILEIYHNSRWGTVCDDGWNSVASGVACRQLGFANYVSYNHGNRITNGFWIDDVSCNGDESLLVNCANSGWGNDDCGSMEGLYLHCTNGGALRLLGSSNSDGILEIYHNNRWGAVCDDGWNEVASRVACRQLGFANYISYTHGNRITNTFWIDDVSCNGYESVLVDCTNSGWGSHNCASTEGVYLSCSP